ncbi:MAG: hypothetical protein N2439_06690 [Anaerolineae bacterium]|nr:hypothetical protein [Anaerolineae bacterium]
MRTYRLARLVSMLLFLAALLYFLGGLIAGIYLWNRGLGAGWGSGFAGWLSIPIFIGTFFGALTLLMMGVVLYFLAAINDNLRMVRQGKPRKPVTPSPAPAATARTELPRTAFQPPSSPPPSTMAARPPVRPAEPPATVPTDLAAELPGAAEESAAAPPVERLPGAEEAARIASELRAGQEPGRPAS